MRRLLPLLLLAAAVAAGCGEKIRDDHFANGVEARNETVPAVVTDAVPVRIGELGASFQACSAAGTTRNLRAGSVLQARAAPFDSADESGRIAAGSRFFVCTRSIDQRWLGVVWDEDGTLAERCGVSAPVASRRAYDGPCHAGWVAAAFVKLAAN